MVPLLRTKLSTGTSSPTKLAHGFLWNWPRRVHFLTECRLRTLAWTFWNFGSSYTSKLLRFHVNMPCPAPQGQTMPSAARASRVEGTLVQTTGCIPYSASHMMKTQCWRKKMTAQIKVYRRKKIRASIRDSSNCFYAPCCRWKQKHGLHIRTRCHIRTLECCDIAAGWLQNMSALFMFTMSMYQNTLWLTSANYETRKNISRYSKQSCCHTRNFSLKCVRFFKSTNGHSSTLRRGVIHRGAIFISIAVFLRLVMLIFNFRTNLACVLSWKPGKHFAIRNWHKRTVCVTN